MSATPPKLTPAALAILAELRAKPRLKRSGAQLARAIGINPQTASRLIRELLRDGLVALEGSMLVAKSDTQNPAENVDDADQHRHVDDDAHDDVDRHPDRHREEVLRRRSSLISLKQQKKQRRPTTTTGVAHDDVDDDAHDDVVISGPPAAIARFARLLARAEDLVEAAAADPEIQVDPSALARAEDLAGAAEAEHPIGLVAAAFAAFPSNGRPVDAAAFVALHAPRVAGAVGHVVVKDAAKQITGTPAAMLRYLLENPAARGREFKPWPTTPAAIADELRKRALAAPEWAAPFLPELPPPAAELSAECKAWLDAKLTSRCLVGGTKAYAEERAELLDQWKHEHEGEKS